MTADAGLEDVSRSLSAKDFPCGQMVRDVSPLVTSAKFQRPSVPI